MQPSGLIGRRTLVEATRESPWIPVIKTAVKFERLQCVIRNMFSPFELNLRSEKKNLFEKFGSSGRIRTYDQSVNSRPLYH